jgi:hypothetical protein
MRVQVIFWRISKRDIPWAIIRMGLDRIYLRRSKLLFWKLLGTGSGETFTIKDANPYRWGVLMVGDHFPDFSHWRVRALATKTMELQPIAVHGSWSKREPFSDLRKIDSKNWDGPIAAVTRARIKWRMNRKFWRAVPAVNESLQKSPGLVRAIGIGEAPIGLQGTFSIWESGAALRDFAYRSRAHQEAIEATERIGWYSEEMFSRFAVVDESGDW